MLERARKNLKIYSYVIIFLAIFDSIRVIITYFMTNDELQQLVQGIEYGAEVLLAAKIFIGIFTAIMALLSIYVGVRGIGTANGTYHGKAFMFWLSLMFICSCLLLIFSAVSNAKEGLSFWDNYSAIGERICDIIFLGGAWSEARKIRNASEPND